MAVAELMLAAPPGGRRCSRLLGTVVALAGVLGACGGAHSVSLADLADHTDRYDGRQVLTSGVVVEFGEDDGALEHHYVIEDADVNRVQLVPEELVAPHIGESVRVEGLFTFDEQTGRLIEVERIEPLTP